MKCDLVLQEKSVEEVYEFSKYEYSSGKNSIVILEGKLLKNLLPQRSVRFTVPLEGKIKVQEKELLPLDSVVEESPISPEQTIDPDLLKSRRQKKIISVAPVKLHPQSGAEGPWIDEEGYPLTPEQIQEMKTRFKENQQEESHGQSFSKEPNIRDQEDQQEDQSKIQQENFSLPIEQRNENEKSRPQENGELSNFER
jgi:hypothetical protein